MQLSKNGIFGMAKTFETDPKDKYKTKVNEQGDLFLLHGGESEQIKLI